MGANLPNDASGLDAGFNPFGLVGDALSALQGNTQDNITQHFTDQLQSNSLFTGASAQFFNIILGGFSSLTDFLSLVVGAITGSPGALGDLTSFLTDRWTDIANLFGHIADLFDVFGGAGGGLAQVQNFVTNLLSLFNLGGIADLAGGSLDINSVWTAIINDILNPLGLLESLAKLTIDTMLSALMKVPVVGGTLEQLFQMLGLIPPSNVQGAAGPATIFDSIFGVIDAWLSGAVGVPGATGGSLADVTNVSGQLASNSAQGAFAWQIVNMLNNTPVARGFLPSGRANYEWPSANTFLSTTQSAALSVSFGLQQAMPIGVISWYGYGTASITAFYINIRKVNLSTGARDLVHHSANIVGNLQPGTSATDAQFMFYEIPTPLAGEATDYFYVEFVPVGGTHHIRGISSTDTINDHPTAAVPCYGTVVDYSSGPNTPSSSLAKAAAGPNVAWVEFAPALGDVADHREPAIFTLDFDGESIPIPSWANRVDAIPLSEGGAGHAGTLPTFNGEPGQPGKFAPVTWARDTDFTDGALVTFNVLSDGSAKLSIPSHDTTAAAGVDGAGAKFNLTPVGRGPGVLDYNGQKYTGGVDQKAGGGAGQNPGGAGNGGNGLFFQPGGVGGKPAAWVCFRQVQVIDEQVAGDTTPPTPPTSMTVDEATFSTLTISWTGATDV